VVLHPLASGAPAPANACRPAWEVVERTQKQLAESYWLVTQPDHAALSGALAANMVVPEFPRVDPLIARAIEVHDAGWAIFDSEAYLTAPPGVDVRGKPISFLEIDPPQFLRAWTASIDRAESVCPAGGYVVSRHFCALGEGRLASAIDAPENSARLLAFLAQEAERRRRLQALGPHSQTELDTLLLVLQFCDLLSLYLCCGAGDAVEFPQQFAPGRVRLRRENQAFVLQPSPFRRCDSDPELSLGVEACRFPSHAAAVTTLAFILW
jgi:uncharacterized protein DUF3891